MHMTNDVGWLRKNLALIVALFSLLATSAGGYASYRLLELKVATLEIQSAQRAAVNAAAIKETRVVLDNHLVQTSSHMDVEKWGLLMARLAAIEAKVDRLR